MLVTVNLGSYVFSNVSLFYVIMVSFVLGLILSYVVYLINAIFTSFAFRGKDNEIKKNKNQVLELTKKVHQLQLENEKLKRTTDDSAPEDLNSL